MVGRAMPIIISCAVLKGGTGKSTVATNLACAFQLAGNRVLLIDADSQGTTRQWAATATENEQDVPPVAALNGSALRKDVARLGAGFDLVVIDTPPQIGSEQRAAMMISDLVLLPVTPGGADLWALQSSLAVLEEAQSLRPELKAALILNRFDKRTTIASALKRAVKDAGIPILKTTLGQRAVYGEALTVGSSVLQYAPKSIAAKEIAALAKEISKMVKQ